LTEPPVLEVRVVDARTSRVLWHRASEPGELIELRYQHSVERTPVVEVFRIERDGLHLVLMRFSSQGAGLPTEGYVREGDHFVLRTDRRVGDLGLRVSQVAGQHLVAGADRVDLVALAGDGAAVVLQSGRVPWRFRLPRPLWGPGLRRGALWYNSGDSARPPWP
jgi:hypothetical protein